MSLRHFLSLTDCTTDELQTLIRRGIEFKRMRRDRLAHEPLKGRILAMIFEKSSTRTRVSFEAGMVQLGGHAMFLSPGDTQLGRGETVEDTARSISRMVDAVMIRTFGHEILTRFADYSRVPVINGLSDQFHPCQLLADMQTYWEHRDDIRGRTVVWVGDGNNMCHSYVNAASLLDFHLRICCPPSYAPNPQWLADPRIELIPEPSEALRGAHLVVTDVWASMGQEREREQRLRDLAPYRVTDGLMELADPAALFMHCLPAHRGEEVEAEVIDGAQSVVWDEAENRLHAQKALLEFLLLSDGRS